jgi:hypothetical protein
MIGRSGGSLIYNESGCGDMTFRDKYEEIGCQDGEGNRGRRKLHTGVAYLYPIRRLGKRDMGKSPCSSNQYVIYHHNTTILSLLSLFII